MELHCTFSLCNVARLLILMRDSLYVFSSNPNPSDERSKVVVNRSDASSLRLTLLDKGGETEMRRMRGRDVEFA